jgi:hypothetical protein
MKIIILTVVSWIVTVTLSFVAIRVAGNIIGHSIGWGFVFFGIPSVIMATSFLSFHNAFACKKPMLSMIVALLSLLVFNWIIWRVLSGSEL